MARGRFIKAHGLLVMLPEINPMLRGVVAQAYCVCLPTGFCPGPSNSCPRDVSVKRETRHKLKATSIHHHYEQPEAICVSNCLAQTTIHTYGIIRGGGGGVRTTRDVRFMCIEVLLSYVLKYFLAVFQSQLLKIFQSQHQLRSYHTL